MNSGPTGSGNQLPQDPIGLSFGGGFKRPPLAVADQDGARPTRQGDTLVENPTDRQDDALTETFLGELIEALHGGEILTEPRLLEIWVRSAQIVSAESRIWPHSPRQKAATQGAVPKGGNPVFVAIGRTSASMPRSEIL